ncbi:RNA polymerase subunit sigma [Zhengella mangrovi]|uniref:RNA polymerase subunit sigma n=1 Tax=Zhengella mangrovi TaxID=1982044 RepID=A0A2G1QHA5_9HYPH|nr:sigma-70 family RNA polymerase sigma factor [Zhengella mangrovi]PHP64840.1 RNA polymerase subunit sigma [Zhengella mangrovi]
MQGQADQITELIVRTGLKDRSAFDRLYEATSAKLFAICLRVLRDRGEAEDALQEVFVRVWTRADRFAASHHSPISWLAAIARNHCIDRLRARKAPARPVEEAFDLAADEPGPERLAELSSEGRRIDACMEELETDRAEAVRAAYVMGYSYEELAGRHGVPLNTMRTWLRRSLMKLKECLER